ncbi:hypothetical protein [Kordia antarctica]|nr:hypothetical protein [Kordia antarctica]
MRKLHLLLIFTTIFFVACSNDTENLTNDTLQPLNFSLLSPDKVSIANSVEELNDRITNQKGTIIDIVYEKATDQSIVATIHYELEGFEFAILFVRGITDFKFEKDTVIKFEQDTEISKSTNQDDIYISCSGGNCCYPSGTYNPNNGAITTSCKCEGGNNSVCVMRISKKAPEVTPN